ncbi:cubilin isoform X1 [Bombus pyrosoma]|uniref:cubilin isoform X1 n=2 Tax=Bombus pyrosoma TaxID=396416 RepID=UPI001CB98CC9|nr:cubilin isoform X1 [Bombus pyrosoma]XP_043580061.1 cubilin isoform X1 [Bombus pyrosoma]XP_043580062.1 cubilin isoform X1 [Bombus pyrosoma]XP_043580063.1 cubilin isoform X1 [Bombus pyrosoma]XP_043580064.1 cubilin isoform X1 [Bombus pyrosoma]XP_043580065.1 cubilin isoform X1 [Bombus pyrosoma]XP_043580068.1 cubilin isoform X1 [Bombus pyrosoma]
MASILYWHASGNNLISAAFILFLLLCPRSSTECDQKFISTPDGPSNGTFHAPTIINPEGDSRQCVYIFFAGPRQRVELKFNSFGLRGTPPDGSAVGELPACGHEYMDLYTEIRSENTSKLVETPFGGRFCGPIPPRRRVSLYQGIALSFYTDKNITFPSLFSGTYAFINASEYEVGTPAPSTPCSFKVESENKRNGSILSPTYPGTYPKGLTCSYKFIGVQGQRVRLEFRDFDLFFGGQHCPLDYLKVYDGLDNTSAVIGTYCGQQRNLVLYSSESSLYVLFVTLQRTANTQNRGFKGIFEFSESFVKLDFITTYEGEHIRGSECDQKILSKKESSGFVVSPNYPFPYIPKVVCRYFIYGMQDSQHLERVRLEFRQFKIPKNKTIGDSSCTDGYLKLYLKGQEATDSYDKFDYELCGSESNPSPVVSDGPRLVMVFSSGESQGQGFKACYSFETEYKIPGTAAPDGSCTFTYHSSSRKKGDFNSPRHPSNYPSNTNCTYVFIATSNEQVTLIFDYFKVRTKNTNMTTGHYGVEICQDDWLEIYNTYRDNTEKLIGRYCGSTAPGPVESNLGALGLKVILHSDSELVYSGFKARYTFAVAKPIFGDCGSNISSVNYGVIASPNYPNKYDGPARNLASKTCNWFIRVRPNQRILLHFETFSVEGDQSVRGCPAAVLRIWYSASSTPIEMCGIQTLDKNWTYLSVDNNMRLSFILADKAVGQMGFKATWTEVSTNTDCQNQFLCGENKYCIAESLRCNNIRNCGPNDTTDEENCDIVVQTNNYAVPAGGAIGAVLIALIVCLLCHRELRRRVQTVHLDDLRHRIDERHRCYHNEDLLQHHHHFHHHHHQHQHQYQQQQQQQQHYQDLTSDSRYHLESSTSPMSESDVEEASSLNSV